MTQTDVIQIVRDTKLNGNIQMALRFAFKTVREEWSGSFVLTDLPYPVQVYVAYDQTDVQAVKYVMVYHSITPMVMLDGNAMGYKVHYTGQAKAQAMAKLAHCKWVGIKFYADGKVKLTK